MLAPSDLLKFLFEFYNYASFVKNDTSLDDKERDITALLRSVVNKYPRSLYSTSAKQRKTNPGPPEGGEGGAGSGSNRRSEKRKHDALTDALLESRCRRITHRRLSRAHKLLLVLTSLSIVPAKLNPFPQRFRTAEPSGQQC